jgi:glycosyltransferase involved in cell wall biosynthesis
MDSNRGLISIVTPVYNGRPYIQECIQSVLNQTYTNWELIIVDDGSTDGTCEFIVPFLKNIKIRYYIINNSGPAKARNYALNKANGEYVAFLDADDLWNKDKLLLYIDYFYQNSNCDLLFSNFEIIDENSNIIEPNNIGINYFNQDHDHSYNLFKYDYIGTLTVMLKKEIISSKYLFNTKFKTAEDWDLWIRLSQHYNFCFLNKTLSQYRICASNISRNKFQMLKNETMVLFHNSSFLKKRNFNEKIEIIYYYFSRDLFLKNKFLPFRFFIKLICKLLYILIKNKKN